MSTEFLHGIILGAVLLLILWLSARLLRQGLEHLRAYLTDDLRAKLDGCRALQGQHTADIASIRSGCRQRTDELDRRIMELTARMEAPPKPLPHSDRQLLLKELRRQMRELSKN